MTPERRTMIATLALAVYRGRTVAPIREGGRFDGRAQVAGDADGYRTEYAIADPPEYPALVFSDPPDMRDVPLEEYPPERSQFERDTWRDKGC